MRRLATLITGPNGITDIRHQTTYGGGVIPRDWDGSLMLGFVNGDRKFNTPQEAYESATIRISGSFDD